MKRFFLFDLDGTLADTGEGIMKSAQAALDAFGFPQEPESRLRRFVGPPLADSFQTFYGLTSDQAQEAIRLYRARYREKGVYESPLYPGVPALLDWLSQRAVVCLATSKPLVFAQQILELRGIGHTFQITVGSRLDGSMTDKTQVIGEVLRQAGEPPRSQAVMIGDRRQDILGAKAQGVESVGVEYGYAEAGELAAAGADWIVPTTAGLADLCRQLMGEGSG